MSPKTRRVVQALLYEAFAIAIVGPILAIFFDKPATSTTALAIVMSGIALSWNYVFNAIFERWERRRTVKGRSLSRRLAHGIGFEGGLAILLTPVMAWWLEISLLEAFIADFGLLLLFFVYAVVFQWAFDAVFGLPESARDPRVESTN